MLVSYSKVVECGYTYDICCYCSLLQVIMSLWSDSDGWQKQGYGTATPVMHLQHVQDLSISCTLAGNICIHILPPSTQPNSLTPATTSTF